MAMLREAIERCPEDLWAGGSDAIPFWRVAYHTLFFTHLYLGPDLEAFRPWEHHREEYHNLDAGLEPPDETSSPIEPYTRARILDYWRICDAMVDAVVDELDLGAPTCGFYWYDLPKLDHQINNIRHIQHHAALLSDRLRRAGGEGVNWMGAAPPVSG
jgi:hypothetical protein